MNNFGGTIRSWKVLEGCGSLTPFVARSVTSIVGWVQAYPKDRNVSAVTQSQRNTRTVAPAGKVVCGGTSTRPLALASELSMCEAWRPAECTSPEASTITRMKWRRSARLLNGSASVAGHGGQSRL